LLAIKNETVIKDLQAELWSKNFRPQIVDQKSIVKNNFPTQKSFKIFQAKKIHSKLYKKGSNCSSEKRTNILQQKNFQILQAEKPHSNSLNSSYPTPTSSTLKNSPTLTPTISTNPIKSTHYPNYHHPKPNPIPEIGKNPRKQNIHYEQEVKQQNNSH
jgi:hypothetical protein